MGEWSKSIGEKGEKIVKFLFEEVLNYNSLQENNSINCLRGQKHKEPSAKNIKTTHGIDGLVSYKSPVEDHTLDIGIISSKYTGNEYPKYPRNLFRSHVKDLAFTLECFNNSKLKSSLNQSFTDVNKTEVFGILTWLSNSSHLDFNLVSKLANVQLNNEIVFDKIILLDNNKVNFLYESIFRAKEIFNPENVDFVYHNSGLNFTTAQKKSFGKVFPLNYLYSDIIPLRICNDKEVELHIFVNDDFTENQLSRILNFAKSFDHLNAVDKFLLFYKSYDDLTNDNQVKQVLSHFSVFNLNKNLSIKKFPSDYRM